LVTSVLLDTEILCVPTVRLLITKL